MAFHWVRGRLAFSGGVFWFWLGVSVEPDNPWGSQINQLEQLIDKLECEVRAPPTRGVCLCFLGVNW